MAMSTSNVTAARQRVAGVFFSAATSKATSVTNATTEMSTLTDFKGLGMLSEDGVVMTIDTETTDLLNMDGDTALSITSKHDVKFKCTPMEFLNANVAKEAFGAENVVADNGGHVVSIKVKGLDLPAKCYVFDMHLRDDKVCRVVLPNGELSISGDYAFKKDEAIQAEWEITALPDASGVKAYMYFAVVIAKEE